MWFTCSTDVIHLFHRCGSAIPLMWFGYSTIVVQHLHAVVIYITLDINTINTRSYTKHHTVVTLHNHFVEDRICRQIKKQLLDKKRNSGSFLPKKERKEEKKREKGRRKTQKRDKNEGI